MMPPHHRTDERPLKRSPERPPERYAERVGERHAIAFQASDGRLWRFTGARARVLAMLIHSPGGMTQRDCLKWTIRLGGAIHAMRAAGLAIVTVREGRHRAARYRLVTAGAVIGQRKR